MAQEYGYNTKLFGKPETTIGTAATGNFTRLPIVSIDFGLSRAQIEDDQLIGQGREERDPGLDRKVVGGSAVLPLDVSHIGWWLRTALGAPTTTGSTNYTHTFKSNASALAALTLEKHRAGWAKYELATGVHVASFSLPLVGERWATMTAQLRGLNEVRSGSSGAGTPVEATPTRFLNRQLALTLDGSAFSRVLSGSIEFDNGLEEVPEIRADALMGGYGPGKMSVSGNFTVRLDSDALLAAAEAGTAYALAAAWTIDSNTSLTVTLPRVFLTPRAAPVAGKGAVQAAFDFRAVKDSTEACALKAVLKNQTASYA